MVPPELRAIVGKRATTKTLGTRDERHARGMASLVRAPIDALIEPARTSLSASRGEQPAPISALTREVASSAISG